jgi:DNA polymerase-1
MLDTPVSLGRFVFDLETNGLLDEVTKIHCAVMYDIDTDEIHDFKPHQIGAFLKMWQEAKMLIGHNIIGYDNQVILKIYGLKCLCKNLVDTMGLARLVHSDIKSIDFPLAKAWKKFKLHRDEWLATAKDQAADPDFVTEDDYPYQKSAPQEFPGQFVGSHSLEAWGYRLGNEKKGDYSKDMKAKGLDPWAEWNQEMHDYMIQDGRVNVALYRRLMAKNPTQQSIELEMRVLDICCMMERGGWPFAVKAAEELLQTLQSRRVELEASLVDAFPPWRVQLDDFIPKRDNKTRGYIKDVPVERWETKEFNPGSRLDIADRLISKYGWKPVERLESGQVKIDDDILSTLPYPEAKLLAEYFTVQKRIGQLADGPQAWLTKVRKGKIHARYNSNGAVTGRATHSSPNIAQVPSLGKVFGRECRELFHVPEGFIQLGADQAGLELRCLASFLAAFDGGAYMEIVLKGDVHWENAKALFGLPELLERITDEKHKDYKQHKVWRDVSKTYIYAFLYGAGDGKLGSIIGKGRAAGQQLRARFLKKFPALKDLIDFVKAAAAKGWLKGLDGRVIPVRSDHAALNSLLQSAGAIICKMWMVMVYDGLIAAGLEPGWDGDFVFLGWIHDELQIAVRKGREKEVEAIIKKAGAEAGNPFPSWQCPTAADVIFGMNWAECH